ncbi:MAG: hypothetical protein Q9170_004478 [Blastenia crenularia]
MSTNQGNQYSSIAAAEDVHQPSTPPHSTSPPSTARSSAPPSSQTAPGSLESATSFKEDILPNLNNEKQLFYWIARTGPGADRLWLYNYHGTRFSISPTDEILEHSGRDVDPKDDSCYVHIGSPPYFRSELPHNPTPVGKDEADFFLPLGRLVEHWDSRKYCPTRYACLLNISTSPLSVWLVYDYVMEDGDVFQNTWSVYDDSRDGYLTSNMLPTAKTEELIKGRDLVLLYRDVAEWLSHGDGQEALADDGEILEGWNLGVETRAWTSPPPLSLLDDITPVGRVAGSDFHTGQGST